MSLTRRYPPPPSRPPVLYVAGPLFTPSERRLVEKVADVCTPLGFQTFVPHRDAGIFGPRRGGATRLFRADLAGLAIAQCLVAILNGPEVDPGTAWEVGYAYPRGIPILGYVDDLRAAAGPNPVDMMVSQSCTAIVRTLPALATALRGIHRRLAQAA